MTAPASVSTKPWANFKEANYTVEQWHRACLIHNHTGAPTSKIQCKLPVYEPNGTLNRNGMAAAAAALGGARSSLIASTAAKDSAKKQLLALYKKLNEQPPPSLLHSDMSLDDTLEHYGVRGMKWGVHNGTVGPNATRKERKTAKQESRLAYKDWKKEVGGEKVANEIFQEATKTFAPAVKAINNDPQFKGKDLTKDRKLARQYDAVTSIIFNQHLAQASINRTTTNTGRAMIYQFDRNVGMMRATEHQLVVHAVQEGYPDFIAEMDEFGKIVSLRRADYSSVQQSGIGVDDIDEFFAHFGVKGMKWGVRRSRGGGTQTHHQPGDATDHTRARQLHSAAKAHGTRVLTNKDLQDLNTRLNLEQQYARLTQSGTGGNKAVKGGSKWVGSVLNNVGKQIAAEVLKGHAMAKVKSMGLTAG